MKTIADVISFAFSNNILVSPRALFDILPIVLFMTNEGKKKKKMHQVEETVHLSYI